MDTFNRMYPETDYIKIFPAVGPHVLKQWLHVYGD